MTIRLDLQISDLQYTKFTVQMSATHWLRRFSRGVSSWVVLFVFSLLTITFVCGTTLKEKFKQNALVSRRVCEYISICGYQAWTKTIMHNTIDVQCASKLMLVFYHRTLFQVWVAPWGDPATIGTWIGLFGLGTMLSSLRPRALHVISRACNFDSIPSSRWVIEVVNETKRFWKTAK